jgi:hypothetical protein
MAIQLFLVEDRLVVVETDESHPGITAEDAAVCAAWFICHRPMPGNNREAGYEAMCRMLEEAGLSWPRPEEDAPRIEAMLQALEEGRVGEAEFVDWVCLRVATA